MQRKWLVCAAVSGFLCVSIGAFGAHGLKPYLSEYDLDIFKTAVSYQMWHTLLLALVSFLPTSRSCDWIARLLVLGVLLFSGSLYALAMTKIKWLGMITPLGGMAFLGAWGLLGRWAWRLPD